ncbi:hypothetical protein P9112_009367 [Eukaryota sp. TZLM1-RC]
MRINPTVRTVALPDGRHSENPSSQLFTAAPLLSGTSRHECLKFLQELRTYAARFLSAEEEVIADRSDEEDEEEEDEHIDATPSSFPRTHYTNPVSQFTPIVRNDSVPSSLRHLASIIRKYIHPRILQALPILHAAAAEDDDELLAWVHSNSLIHDEALADRLLAKLSMNTKIKEPLLRLSDYVIRFQELQDQLSLHTYKEDFPLECFIKGLSLLSLSLNVLSNLEEIVEACKQVYASLNLSYTLSPSSSSFSPRNNSRNYNQFSHHSHHSSPFCTFCKTYGHTISHCPDPSCRISRNFRSRPLSTPHSSRHSRHQQQPPRYQHQSTSQSNFNNSQRYESTPPRPASRIPHQSLAQNGERQPPQRQSRNNQRKFKSFQPTINKRHATRSQNQVNAIDIPEPEILNIPLSVINDCQSNSNDELLLIQGVNTSLEKSSKDPIYTPRSHTQTPKTLSHSQTSITPKLPSFLYYNLLANGHPIKATIDTAAKTTCITMDLAKLANLEIKSEKLPIYLANQEVIYAPGLAIGTLTFKFEGPAKVLHVKTTMPILPGKNQLLLGCDVLKKLGLMTNSGIIIRLNEEHTKFLSAKVFFHHHIVPAPAPAIYPKPTEICHITNDHSSLSQFKTTLANKGTRVELPPAEAELIIQQLHEFEAVFADDPHPLGIGCPAMEIPFIDESKKVCKPARFLSPEKLKIANDEFDSLIEKGYAVPNITDWSSPICLVVLPNKAPRLTGDYSGKDGVNDLSVTIEANLPRIADVLTFLSSAKYIATLDLPKAFWQMNLAPEDQHKTALSIPGRSIMFTRAAFGPKNVPAVFQKLMNEFFKMDGVFIYIDDIIICSNSISDFSSKIRKVLKIARKKRVRFGLKKCEFLTYKSQIKILGCLFQNHRRFICPSRINALSRLPRPKTVAEVRSFVGSVNFIRDWLPNLSSILEPISSLLKKSNKIAWTKEAEDAFTTIIELIKENIPLNLPDRNARILVSTDASDVDDPRCIEPEIDEENLFAERLLDDPALHNPPSSSDNEEYDAQADWTFKEPNEIFANWLQQLYEAQQNALNNDDPLMKTDTEVKMINDVPILMNTRKNKIIVPERLKRHVLLTIHGSTRSGHPPKNECISTLLASDYWWPNHTYDMAVHIKNCIPCQKTADAIYPRIPASGKLWSDRPFDCLHADVIGPLNADTEDYKYILVFVCAFTRFTILTPLKILNATEVAYAILWNIVGNYGIPGKILSDNGPEFSNATMTALCTFLNIEKSFSVPYFHQSNGLVERRHREVLQTLRKLLLDLQAHSNWSTYIPITQLIINTRRSKITEFTPFELIFGTARNPKQLPLALIQNATLNRYNKEHSYIRALKNKTETLLKKWEEAEAAQEIIRRKLSSKNAKNAKPLKDDLKPGNLALKLAERAAKFHGKWYGPFLVEKVSTHPKTVLLLNLITGTKTTCSQHLVKKCYSEYDLQTLKAYASTDVEENVIDKLIDHDLTDLNNPGYLVRWMDGSTTWEGEEIQKTTAYFAYKKKYIEDTPGRPARSKLNRKDSERTAIRTDAAEKAEAHKTAALNARRSHKMSLRQRK